MLLVEVVGCISKVPGNGRKISGYEEDEDIFNEEDQMQIIKGESIKGRWRKTKRISDDDEPNSGQ